MRGEVDRGAEAPRELTAEPLTAEAFAPFGEVIEAGDDAYSINGGLARRRDQAARLDVDAAGGRLRLGVVRAAPFSLPLPVTLLERHPLGSQAFVPMTSPRFLVVVAPAGGLPRAEDVRAFIAEAGQGVHYRRGVWHRPLTPLDRCADFLVLDREGPAGESAGENVEETTLDRALVVRAI